MSAKHTPGPWRQNGTQVHGPKMGLLIAGVCFSRMGDNLGFASKTVDDANANARLIAAAPDLLEALKDVLDAYVSEWNEARATDDSSLKRARAAIAKAEGRS